MSKVVGSDVTTVKASRENYSWLKQYSDITGVPMTRVVNEALDTWRDSVGEARLEVFREEFKKC